MKKIKKDLSEKNIKEIIEKLNLLKSNFEKINEEIIDELAEYTEREISKNISSTPYKDGNEDITTFIDKVSKKRIIVGMKGSQALYNEFGTGTVGENSSHENRDKAKGKLNWYNSGKTIRGNYDITGNSMASQSGIPQNGLYWTYEVNGAKVYTQGIPAGKQVFNASISLRKQKNNIIKKKVSDVLSKL